MKKEFTYREHKFKMVVTLNASVERRMNGVTRHLLTIDSEGYIPYSIVEHVEDKDLESRVTIEEDIAKRFIDKKLDGVTPDERLLKLGFK